MFRSAVKLLKITETSASVGNKHFISGDSRSWIISNVEISSLFLSVPDLQLSKCYFPQEDQQQLDSSNSGMTGFSTAVLSEASSPTKKIPFFILTSKVQNVAKLFAPSSEELLRSPCTCDGWLSMCGMQII